MLIPVAPAAKLYTENKSLAVPLLWQGLANRHQSNVFTEKMEATRKSMAQALTTALITQLKSDGFDAQVLDGVDRPASSPEDIDYTKLPTSHPVMHVYFDEVGMYSSRLSIDYVPRVNVTAYLFRPKNEESIYSGTIYYGADAGKDSLTSIAVDARHKWRSFEDLVQQPENVAAAYATAIDSIAARIAGNVKAAVPRPAQTATVSK